ncbi:Phosphoinositide phospholipase C 6 [Hordeum vulgare]|nr:Phosphoinositide phospholipase C 6 [Hordeum vulgare]
MGIFGNNNGKGKGKGTPDASSSRAPPPPPPSPPVRFRPECRRLHIPVHQARWHWEYKQPLPYPDVTLPHHWYLDPQRILVPTVPRRHRAHDDEVSRCHAQLMPEQRRLSEYTADSPNWEAWFALEHEEQRRSGVDAVPPSFPPPPPHVQPKDMEAEAEYQAALEEALQQALEASRLEEDARWDGLEQALTLSAAGDSVHTPLFVPPPPPSPPIQPKSATRKRSSRPPTWPEEAYIWTGQYREWVSPPPLAFTLPRCRSRRPPTSSAGKRIGSARSRPTARSRCATRPCSSATRSRSDSRRRRSARLAAMPLPQQTPEEASLAAYQAAFGWTGPAPTFIDLTDDGDGGADAKGKGKAEGV